MDGWLWHRCRDFHSYMYNNAVQTKNQIVWMVYGAVVTLVVMFSLSLIIGSSGALALATCVGSVLQLLLTGIVCGELFLMVRANPFLLHVAGAVLPLALTLPFPLPAKQMLVADFCMEPSGNALGLVEDRYYDMAAFYSTCHGTNPLIQPLASAALSLEAMNRTITALYADDAACEGNVYLKDCSRSISYAYSNLTAVEDSAQCQPVASSWDDLFNEAVCDNGYTGVYITWISQGVTTAAVFAAVVAAGLLVPYCSSKWTTGAYKLFPCMSLVLTD